MVSSALAAPRGIDASARAAVPVRERTRRVEDSKWLPQKFVAAIWRKLAAVSGVGGQSCGSQQDERPLPLQ